MDIIQIADQVFPIAEANLTAYIGSGQDSWRVSWSIELSAQPHEVNGQE
ncbi:hypothetical protein ACFQDN_13415 [Pseudomonas asuensis]|jgi:hypothetical protein|uniref:Uncharacterized protein n=1 Tax=Pseudomonas asuensis TaxID=1825787 RepID=A0ABQ2H359_9PSED|nr:hypothetical protein [Pseudomonas asuensis]GGM27499.1 hypothetical protein GCM10009425_42630 [Pseudomonas asuensis]